MAEIVIRSNDYSKESCSLIRRFKGKLINCQKCRQIEASRSWFQRFRSSGNLQSIALEGESASADIITADKFNSI